MAYPKTISFVFLVQIIAASMEYSNSSTMYQGIVGSPITLHCPSIMTDFETVKWGKSSSDKPIISYFPKDGYTGPDGYDSRLSIINEKGLVISALRRADTGNYTCIITAAGFRDELFYIVLSVEEGCVIPHTLHPPAPLSGCEPGNTIYYKTQCNFRCPNGTYLIGDISTECQANGSLTNNVPKCEEFETCPVRSLQKHPIQTLGLCSNSSAVPYGTICAFSCDVGYVLNGSDVLTCNETGKFDYPYPTCEEIQNTSEWNLLPLLALIIPGIALVVILPLMVYFRLRESKNEHRTPDPEECPLQKMEDGKKTSSTNVENAMADGGNQEKSLNKGMTETSPFNSAIHLLPSHRKGLFTGFLSLLTGQMKIEKRRCILQKLHEIEETIIIPRFLSSSEHADEDSLNDFLQKVKSTARMTREQAFAFYVTVIISFIENRKLAERQQQRILAVTGTKKRNNTSKKIYSETGKHLVSQDEKAREYFGLTQKVFELLLKMERSSVMDKKEKSEQTSNVADIIVSFVEEKNRKSTEDASSARTFSRQTSISSGEELKADDAYFVKLCVNEVRRCLYLEHAVDLRHKILHEIFSK